MALSRRSSIKPPEPERTLTPEGQVRWDLIVAGVAAVVITIDQITKAMVHARFSGNHIYDVVPVIGNVLTIIFDENKGAAFSSFIDQPLLLGLLIAIAVGVICYLYWSNRSRDYPLLKLTFGLILGGAIGNLIDRVRLGYVTDFVHFQLPALHFDFAVFNIADSAISIGVVLLAFVFWTLPREATPAPGEDSPNDATVSPARASTATSKTTATGKLPASGTTKTPTNPVKSTDAGAANGARAVPGSKTPTNPVKGSATGPLRTATAGVGAKTAASVATKSPTKGAPVATATRSGSSKRKSKRR